MSAWQLALSELVRPLSSIRRRASKCLKALGAGVLLVAAISSHSTAARAECELSEAEIAHGASVTTGVPEDAVAPIDPFDVRKALGRQGVEVGGVYYGESFGNWGGFDQGVEYDGVLELYMKADMHKLGLWKGLCFHADAFQIHGNSITAANIGSLMPVSNLEATPSTRLFELWFEQHLFDDKLAIKFGQLAADAEFIISEGAGWFLNGTWGWPSIAASDLPGGGPAYPLATPGVRVKIDPSDKFSLMVGVYNGDPAPHCGSPNPQVCNSDGLDFSLDAPPLLMAEGAYTYNQAKLPGTVKVGGWNNFGTFENLRFDSARSPIAETGHPGMPLDNDWGLYGIVDQLVWRVPNSENPVGVGIFARVVGAPSDRNVVDFYADGGITFTGMIPGRPNDGLAVGFAYTGISEAAHGLDIDLDQPVARNYEALIEICYTYEVKPGWTVQPDFQYFFQPGANVPNDDGEGAVKNAAVLGARTSISF
jgi:porin